MCVEVANPVKTSIINTARSKLTLSTFICDALHTIEDMPTTECINISTTVAIWSILESLRLFKARKVDTPAIEVGTTK